MVVSCIISSAFLHSQCKLGAFGSIIHSYSENFIFSFNC